MKVKDIIIRVVRKLYRIITGRKFYAPECDCDRQSSNDKIYELLASGKPCMIARFGTVEINCITNYLCVHSDKSYCGRIIDFIKDNTHTPWWYDKIFYHLRNNAGVIDANQEIAERFSERYLQDAPEIDMLACHQYYEKFMPLRDDIKRVQLEMLYPFFVERPWTRILKGKKVLVVHPFVDTIKSQYQKREHLFSNPDVLPKFELKTLKAVQTIAGTKSEFASWFDALKYMEDEIDKIDFDIAIIGCGAYGLPLAAHVKRIGKQAVHTGGGTQLFFGIKGKRWVEYHQGQFHYRPGVKINHDYRQLFNEYWVFPGQDEKPKYSDKVEGSCYW